MPPLLTNKFSTEQENTLQRELVTLFACRNETIPVTLTAWVDTFALMRIPFQDLVEMIRTARLTKRFGLNTTLADIIGEEITEKNTYKDIHNKYFKYLQSEIKTWLITFPCENTTTIRGDVIPDSIYCDKCKINHSSKDILEDILFEETN